MLSNKRMFESSLDSYVIQVMWQTVELASGVPNSIVKLPKFVEENDCLSESYRKLMEVKQLCKKPTLLLIMKLSC